MDIDEIRELTRSNESFSNNHPGLQIAWDTVSSGVLKECARKYRYEIIEGWTLKRENVHLRFGLLMHSAVEVFYHARARGLDHDASIRQVVRVLLEKAGKRISVPICQDCGHVQLDNGTEFGTIVCIHCNGTELKIHKDHFFPWESENPNKNRKNLIRTAVWYLDAFKDTSEETIILSNGEPAVELWFRYNLDLDTPDGKPYIMTGHLDRLLKFLDKHWFQDLKTSKNAITDKFFAKFSPDNQMYFYFVGGKIVFDQPIVGGIIDGAQIAVHFSKFQRGFLHLTKAQMEEWLHDFKMYLRLAEIYAEAGHWPMNDKACDNFGGCEFRGVCNKDPAVRDVFLRKNFRRRTWDPLQARKD